MRPLVLASLLSATVLVPGCGGDPATPACVVPQAPGAGVNTGTRLIFWDPVPGAASYNFYLRAVEGCDMLDSTQHLSAADLRTGNVRSPLDISAFDRCHTCYYFNITAVDGTCESRLDGGAIGFTLGPCR